MQITIETMFGIALAHGVPLIGTICVTLLKILGSISSFSKTLEKAERSLDHNRNEHTKMINLIESLEKTLNQRIELLEERLKPDDDE